MTPPTLHSIHHKLGLLLLGCNRLMIAILLAGAIFTMTAAAVLMLVLAPQQWFHTQSLEINVIDGQWEADSKKDSSWDGMIAGASIGYAYGRSVPVFGPALGMAIGGAVGYQLDDRI